MSLYDALLSRRDDLYARVSPDVLVDEFLLPLAARLDKLTGEFHRQQQVIDSLQNRLNAPPVVQRTVLSGGYGDDLVAAGV